ncbi:MAG: polysaccharide deacetylase [Lachnospiraceae bacterium]|nr:polysaccharide deacetylase [Lachnospiraceae bacterium]
MEDRSASGLREQQLRRRRIQKMKSSIVAGMVIWILITSILMVTLLVRMFQLEGRLDKLTESMISVEQVAENQKQNSAGSPDGSTKSSGSEAEGTVPGEQDNILEEGEKQKVYLTFDDGPSENTEKILDILKEKNVKATFFVIGQEDDASKALYQRIVAEGHTLGMHSFSHKYSIIYESLEAFSEDVAHLQSYLAEVTGVTPEIMRFPGGSSNQVSNTDMAEFIRYLNEKEITYYDWNVASGDATSQAYTPDELVQNVMSDVGRYKTSIVLMHDASTKASTVEALGPMIDQLQEMGAELLPIDENTTPIQQIPADSVD